MIDFTDIVILLFGIRRQLQPAVGLCRCRLQFFQVFACESDGAPDRNSPGQCLQGSGLQVLIQQVCGRGKDLQAFRMRDKKKCLCFRVRTKYDERGNVIEAYYGKIYGDIVMGWSYQGVSSVSFLYYFNPTLNDRNLEWDMKNNLCPNPGRIGQRQP